MTPINFGIFFIEWIPRSRLINVLYLSAHLNPLLSRDSPNMISS